MPSRPGRDSRQCRAT